MKLIKFFGIIAILSLVGCENADKGREISFSPRKGESYGLKIQKDAKITKLENGQIITFDEKIIFQLNLNTIDFKNDEYTVDAYISSIKLDANSNIGKINFDSERIKEKSFLDKPFSKIIGRNFQIIFNRSGNVKQIVNYDAIENEALQETDSLNPIVSQTIKDLIRNEFDSNSLKESLKKIQLGYDLSPKVLNEKWHKEDYFECYGAKLKTNNSFQLIDRSNGAAVVEVNCISEGLNITSNNDTLIYEGHLSGRIMIDEIIGWVRKANFHYAIINKTDLNLNSKANDIVLNADVILKIEASNDQIFRKISFSPASVIKGDGLGLTFVGMTVVFAALFLLFIMFSYFKDILEFLEKKKGTKEKGENIKEKIEEKKEEFSGELIAAIGAALHLYSQEMHDQETQIITIEKVSRNYSPWSSKIYMLRKHPRF
jgi:Na+-transporting methylmalonyl-CoA/oxaloacetate decarboxylase gamma subunit